MFSSSLTRATHRATVSAVATAAPTASAAHRCLATRPTHQRRPSSSKASCPPDSSNKPAPAAKVAPAASSNAASSASATPASAPRRTKRASRLNRVHTSLAERMNKGKDLLDHYATLPAVPALRHLTDKDLGLSSFFSLHRPLSVTTTIPPPSTPESFHALFAPHPPRDPWHNGNSAERRPEDVIYTLHNTIETLESTASHAQDEGVRGEIIQESSSNHDGVRHLDGLPTRALSVTLDELVAQFRPFRAPPPPQPFPDEVKASGEKKKTSRQAKTLAQRPQQKSYQTTITFTDITTADGTRTLRPHVSPLVRVPDVQLAEPLDQPQAMQEPPQLTPRIRQPFLEKMRRRQQMSLQNQQAKRVEEGGQRSSVIRRAPSAEGRPRSMSLLSVKRQRKLKMKKHKYKKLMKRTRTLRRRLDRT